MYKKLKGLYDKSIFVENVEEVINSKDYFNRADEWLIKEICVGYLIMALDCHPEIKELLTEEAIDDLIYSIACNMDSFPFKDAIDESKKFDLRV